MERQERQAQAQQLAAEILRLAQHTLMVHLRFLDRALSHLTLTPDEKLWFAADGRHLYFEPWYVLGQYKAERNVVNRDLLHALFHCIFRHSMIGPKIDRLRWDLACDIAVEYTINSLQLSCLAVRRAELQTATIKILEEEIGTLTSERIYHWLCEKSFADEELQAMRKNFAGDSHGLWYGKFDPSAEHDPHADTEEIWQEVARRMQTELETFCEDKNSPLVQALRALNRKQHSYTEFLRRFGEYGEVTRLSDEEIDYNFYTYGMSLYGNIPLIEPLEYREEKRLREFVIAIDTSGSVRGDVVQSFVQHIYDILHQQENFFGRMDLHILQCDDQVREDAHITCHEDFERYLAELEIKGLGKTDFRPAFAYVDALRRQGELQNLRGVVYFTDGEGIFPAQKPDYDVAFIIHRNDYREPQVPVWAMHMMLTEAEILDERFE